MQKYWYDANGNATRRISGSQDITLTYDAENRLTAISGGVTASYVYDGDGKRVKETVGGATTVYIGNTFEWTGSTATMKSYYYAGAVRVAMRTGTSLGTVNYLLSDHLGSQALTLTSAGARLNTNTELRYYPWGGGRYVAGTTPTSYNFTGQRKDSGSGLLFYNARWYDPTVGRFLQADTIVPQPGNPQSLNRYSYALNNAVRFTDPTGMFSEDEIEAYLRNQYGEQWKSYWDAWHSDKVFWQMLILADYDDVLFAPTTSLTSGTFVHAGNTFGFSGQHALYEYQGYGPYRLTNGQGTIDKLDAQTSITAHPVDTDSPRYQTWEQLLYRYDAKGPHYSGYNRIVSYQFSSLGLQLDAGSGLPWLGTYAAPRLVNGIATRLGAGALCGPLCMFAITLGSGAGFANGVVILRYETQVNLADKRTFLQANDVCYPPPPDESANLWK